MFFLKKVILCMLFVGLMYFGGAGTQSGSTSLQGMGFVGVILGFVVLYILFKIMWTAMSFTMTIAIIGGVILFILYCLGIIGSNSPVGKIFKDTFNSADISQEYSSGNIEEVATAPELEPVGLAAGGASFAVGDETNTASQNNGGFWGKVAGFFVSDAAEQQNIVDFNPLDYPAIEGVPSVMTGSVLRLKGINVKLLGIDAPNPEQTCSNARGQAYSCGHKSITWLQDWLSGQPVECRILGKIVKQWATGVCFLGQYDVAAAVVNAGWAVAYTKNTDVYLPYEKQARRNSRGMWSGRFYRPSDWRKLQTRRAEVVIERKSNDSGWFNFDGWF